MRFVVTFCLLLSLCGCNHHVEVDGSYNTQTGEVGGGVVVDAQKSEERAVVQQPRECAKVAKKDLQQQIKVLNRSIMDSQPSIKSRFRRFFFFFSCSPYAPPVSSNVSPFPSQDAPPADVATQPQTPPIFTPTQPVPVDQPAGPTPQTTVADNPQATSPPIDATDESIIALVLANGESREASGSNDRAVVFGNNFPGTDAELHECVNDAKKNVINLVRFEHFNPKNIRLILNQQCTKANYEKWSKWLFEGVLRTDRAALINAINAGKPTDKWVLLKSGDIKRFWGNSSHGAEDTDADGKICDIIVTWDMISRGVWDSSTEVSAQFWYDLLRSTDVNFVFLNDCCHSGGVMRHALGLLGLQQGRIARSIEGPPVVQARVNAATQRDNSRAVLSTISGCVFAVCLPSELSEEALGIGGFGTEYFWQARKGLDILSKNSDIVRQANKLQRENAISQHMTLIGPVKPLYVNQN